MDFEKIYAKLPDSIKYNNYILDFFLKIPKKLQNLNKKSNQLNSQNQLLDLLFTSCDIKIKGNLRNVQLLYIELLRFVDNVCKKHDIDYWLEGGTLIGAVRHGGFIPWDDDIDLSIMRKDYEKLIKVLPEEISKYEYFKENCGLSLLIENQKNYLLRLIRNDFGEVIPFWNRKRKEKREVVQEALEGVKMLLVQEYNVYDERERKRFLEDIDRNIEKLAECLYRCRAY